MGQRKGLGDLLEAFSKIRRKDVELILMGTPLMEMEFYRKQFDDLHMNHKSPTQRGPEADANLSCPCAAINRRRPRPCHARGYESGNGSLSHG